jgi:dihydroorotate dehydrogenase
VNNVVGLAAGFDKNAEAIDGLSRLGFGLVEVGSITPQPQPGNDKPRVFRLYDDKGVINRYGFNSRGCQFAKENLRIYRERQSQNSSYGLWECFAPHLTGRDPLIGVNLGKNKETVKAEEDYVTGVFCLGQYADYLVVNVSSPNTPGLRTLQAREHLKPLLQSVVSARDEVVRKGESRHKGMLPLLVKISPDLSEDDARDIAGVVVECGLDGIIISNTTMMREGLQSPSRDEVGGLSGKPLHKKSLQMIRLVYQHTKGTIPIIGVGGIWSGSDAYAMIRAGASAIQVYTVLTYEGAGQVRRIKDELIMCLQRDGFSNVSEAVGIEMTSAIKISQ